ncbi:maltase A1-like [Phlebotomus argentipes]|uniref:maltase A1-like n=1 Tax=Phlebotomus argentipes TaxID=94469 RepID=UPI002893416E|nr:maltase A1-like [Phlebotomus argentipes]
MRVIIVALLASVVRAEWYTNGNFYQIYPRSFMDSDGNGIGDLNGITQRLQYVKDLGMSGTWLSPIFKSPLKDFGYDISDYNSIQPEYGSMEDFEALIEKAEEIGIRIILDFVPNHTSDQHDWFQKSVRRETGFEDFYVWHPGNVNKTGHRVPPTNWVSVFRGSAWTWNEERGEYFYHAFLKEQPDLNYRDPKLVEAMKDVVRFWMRKGVSGFRIDAIPYLFEVAPDSAGNYPDEPLTGPSCPDPTYDCYTKHIYTQNLPETWDMIYQWRETLDEYSSMTKTETKIMMIEAYTPLNNIKYIFSDGHGRKGAQLPFNFELISNVNGKSSAKDAKHYIDAWIDRLPEGEENNWVMGNHDNKRIATKFGIDRADLINVMLQTLPGIAITYNGEEMALLDVYISWEDTIDPAGCNTSPDVYLDYSRDPNRTPFPWNANKNAGFSTADKTWLPVSPDYKQVNVEAQENSPVSHLKIFKKLTKMHQHERAFTEGKLRMKLVGADILAYERRVPGTKPSENFVVILNFSNNTRKINIHDMFPQMSETYKIEVVSLHSSHNEGDKIDGRNFEVKPNEAFVLRGEASRLYSSLILLFTLLSASIIG